MKKITQKIMKKSSQNSILILYSFSFIYLPIIFYLNVEVRKHTASFFSGFDDIFVIYNLTVVFLVLTFIILHQIVKSYITLFLKYFVICAYFIVQFYFVEYNNFDFITFVYFLFILVFALCSIFGFIREFSEIGVNIDYNATEYDVISLVICDFLYFSILVFVILLSYIPSALSFYALLYVAVMSFIYAPIKLCVNLIVYSKKRCVNDNLTTLI